MKLTSEAEFLNFVFTFLAIFRNEITTILTIPTTERGEWGGHVFHFGGPWLQIRRVNFIYKNPVSLCVIKFDYTACSKNLLRMFSRAFLLATLV